MRFDVAAIGCWISVCAQATAQRLPPDSTLLQGQDHALVGRHKHLWWRFDRVEKS